MYIYRSKVTLLLVVPLLTIGFASAALEIETFDENLDFNTVSSDSQIVQIVKVTDSQDSPVNESVLLNATGNEFQYYYDGNWSDMEHLKKGYYYAGFDSGSSVGNIQYRIVDQSPGGGETLEYESLNGGQLNVNILNNFTGRYEAGSSIQIEAEVENQGEYYEVDSATGELIVTDNGGTGTYSSKRDEVLAGYPPANTQSLTNTNPWKNTDHVVAMSDSNTGDDWNPGSDVIVLDYHNGGTVSTEPDHVMNTGDDSTVDTTGGYELNHVDDISDNKYFVFEGGEDVTELLYRDKPIVYDNDSDGRYTKQSDKIIAGREPNEGENISFTNRAPSRLWIASYDENNGGSWDSTEDLIVFDRDNDSQFTNREDVLMLGSTPPEAANLEQNHVSEWNDGDYTVPNSTDLEVYDANADGGRWNSTVDGIWIEEGTNGGYQSEEDTLVAGNPPEGNAPNQVNSLFSQWSNISGFDRNSGDSGFDPAADAVIRDFNSGGTYSEDTDDVIAGSLSPSADFGDGSSFTSPEGFSDSWSIDIIESIEGGKWESSQDTLLIDRNEGGTYSKRKDQVINHGDSSVDAVAGADLKRLNSAFRSRLMWSDLNDNGVYDSGDELFVDRDADEIYTAQSDEQLAGLSLDIAAQGTSLDSLNLWQETPYDDTPILFFDSISGDGWDATYDAIVHDLDEDGVYTAHQDRIIDGNPSVANNGDSISSTDATNTSVPDVQVRVTSGTNTSGPLELGRTPEGVYTGDIDIPEVYGTELAVQVNAETPVSGLKGMTSDIMKTRAKGIGFGTEETSISFYAQKRGEYEESVKIENLLDTANTIELKVSEDIKNITSYSEEYELSPQGNETANITFEIGEVQSYEGDIKFTEKQTGITEQVEVEINTPECYRRDEDICLSSVGSLSVETDERDNITRSLEFLNIGDKGSERNLALSLDGNISEHVGVGNSTSFFDSGNIDLEFQATLPGFYSGTLNVESADGGIDVPIEMSSNFVERDAGMNVTPEEIQFDTTPKGENAVIENVRVENTGTLDFENISFKSSGFDVTQDTSNGISSSDMRNHTLTLNSVTSDEGEIQVVVYSREGKLTQSIQVSGSTVKPVSEMKNEINSKVSDLRRKATSSDSMNQLTQVETQVSSIQTSWDQGNYERAESMYQTAMSDLTSVEAQVQSSDTGDTGGSGNENTGTEPSGSETESSGGGAGIIIFIIFLMLILGAGFVVYTSYYPEEGDPLYDVLGDREQ